MRQLALRVQGIGIYSLRIFEEQDSQTEEKEVITTMTNIKQQLES